MSHFTVLTAVALPGQLDAALGQMPDRQPINKIVSALIQSCSGDTVEFDAQKHRPIDDQVRFECLVADLVDNQLAPYCEGTNDPRYLEFIDCTEECRRTYENTGSDSRVSAPHRRRHIEKRLVGSLRHSCRPGCSTATHSCLSNN